MIIRVYSHVLRVFLHNFMPCDPVRRSVAGRAFKVSGRALLSALQTHPAWRGGYHAAGVVCGFTDSGGVRRVRAELAALPCSPEDLPRSLRAADLMRPKGLPKAVVFVCVSEPRAQRESLVAFLVCVLGFPAPSANYRKRTYETLRDCENQKQVSNRSNEKEG